MSKWAQFGMATAGILTGMIGTSLVLGFNSHSIAVHFGLICGVAMTLIGQHFQK